MRKIKLIFFCVVFTLFTACASMGKNSGLDDAIRQTANEITADMPQGTKIAVLKFTSPSVELSDYIIEELSLSLAKIKKLIIVDRKNLDLIRNEMNFQMSGDVDDESAISIGKLLGAQYIIMGSFVDAGPYYRLRANAISVESAAREAPSSIQVNRNDRQVAFFMKDVPFATAKNTNEVSIPKNPFIGTWFPYMVEGEILDKEEVNEIVNEGFHLQFNENNKGIVPRFLTGGSIQTFNCSYSIIGGNRIVLIYDNDGKSLTIPYSFLDSGNNLLRFDGDYWDGMVFKRVE